MRAVVDTNVLVSGIFWTGTPQRILEAWYGGAFEMIISLDIFTEYQETLLELARKTKKPVDWYSILALIGKRATWVDPVKLPNQICTDPDDDKFIAAALSAKARYIVTGDKALLKVSDYSGVQIVTAQPFLTQLT